jgi:leucyl-tRNA synthetase
MHRTIKKTTDDIEALKYNTAVAALMEYVNGLQHRPSLSSGEVRTLLLLLAPFAPFVTEELWEQTGGKGSVHAASWPELDESLARATEVAVAVQIDGKTREVIQVEAGSEEAAVVERARALPKVQRHLDGRAVARTVYVRDRLVNFVTKG